MEICCFVSCQERNSIFSACTTNNPWERGNSVLVWKENDSRTVFDNGRRFPMHTSCPCTKIACLLENEKMLIDACYIEDLGMSRNGVLRITLLWIFSIAVIQTSFMMVLLPSQSKEKHLLNVNILGIMLISQYVLLFVATSIWCIWSMKEHVCSSPEGAWTKRPLICGLEDHDRET